MARAATRRLAVLAALLVVGCVAITAAVLVGVYEYQTRLESTRLFDAAAAYVDDPSRAPDGMYLAVSTPGGMVVTPGMPRGLPDTALMEAVAADGRPRQTNVDDDAATGPTGYYEVLTHQVSGRTAQIVLDRSAVEETREHLWTAVGLSGVVAVLLAAGSAALLARKAASPLAQTVAMQRRFVADASHELRTPLTLLSTRAQMQLRRLEREQASTRATTEAQAIVRDVATMTEIVDDLLSTSAQPRDEGCEPVDVADLARQVVDAATPHATERHIRIRYASRLTPQDPRQVGGRPAALRRALTALVDNAIEHAAGEVEVSVAATRRHLTVSVSDDGPGVDESVRDRIFEPFFTGTASSTSASPSASPSDDPGSSRRHYGIGLALVAGIATDHKGEITVAEPREAGSGTRFVLSLPAWRH